MQFMSEIADTMFAHTLEANENLDTLLESKASSSSGCHLPIESILSATCQPSAMESATWSMPSGEPLESPFFHFPKDLEEANTYRQPGQAQADCI